MSSKLWSVHIYFMISPFWPICTTYYLQQIQILPLFSKMINMAWYFVRNVCWQAILIKYHTLFFRKLRKTQVIKFVVCCSVFLKEFIGKKSYFWKKIKSANLKEGMKSMQLQIFRLLLTFANRLDPNQAQHKFQFNLEQKMFATQMVFLIIIFSLWKNITRRQQ